MADEPIRIGRTAEFEESRGTVSALGGKTLETPHGAVRVFDAPGFSTLLVDADAPADRRIAILLYDPALEAGLAAQLDATQARTIAASLLRLAVRLDPGKAN